MLGKQHIGLFMEMRLRKTLLTIRFLKLCSVKLVLVVCPFSAFAGWQDDLQREGINPIVIMGNKSQRLEHVKNISQGFYIVNREAYISIPNLAGISWGAIILDESICIANPQADITKFFCSHFRAVKYRIILNGTPDPESELQLFCQLAFLDPFILNERNYYEFRMKHFCPDPIHHKWLITPNGKKYLSSRLEACCYFLKLSDVNLQGDVIHKKISCKMPDKMRVLYHQCEQTYMLKNDKTFYATQVHLWLRKLSSGFSDDKLEDSFKLNILKRLLENELDKKKVIIWCQFISEIKAIQNHLGNCLAIYGEIKPLQRSVIIRAFQYGTVNWLVCQPETVKFGSKLHHADTMIYFSSPEGALTREQTEKRILDIDKKNAMLIIDLVSFDSVEEDILLSLQNKETREQSFHREMKRIQNHLELT
jgi:hypothetical protein